MIARLRQLCRRFAAADPATVVAPPDRAGSDAAAERARLGRQGEEAAARLLADKGFAILARNWRQGKLELDIVCRDAETLVFVEVKSRRGDSLARPDEAMTPRKRRTLVRAAQAWLATTETWSSPCRFDVVTVTAYGPNSLHLEHIPHAFALDDAGAAVDRGHAPWQPW
ncbi:YraN family protein [uncultured Desulfovibrio sp.]|uniref:YraN family protein n=1 Tax=uncultured Desulfovibrio sp. TaxID=167968 RepID=UPI00263191F3|nr:YraN family protein [uncultured Desulfovibrio sp.]